MLHLGGRDYDLSVRTLVVAVVDGEQADDDVSRSRLVGLARDAARAGADVIDLGPARPEAVAAVAGAVDLPVCVHPATTAATVAALAAGAAMAADAGTPGFLEAVAAAAGVALVAGNRAGSARQAGLGPDRVVIDAGTGAGPDRSDPSGGAYPDSYPVLISTARHPLAGPPGDQPGDRLDDQLDDQLGDQPGVRPGDRLDDQAAVALAVARGARLVRSPDVAGVRRACDILGVILGAA